MRPCVSCFAARVLWALLAVVLALAPVACGSTESPSTFRGSVGQDSGPLPLGNGNEAGLESPQPIGDAGATDALIEAADIKFFDATAGFCGDGKLDPGEQCDDGNTRPGDGCSATCTIEAGWSCTAGKCTYQWVCGNGRLDPGEQCDLGPLNGGAMSGCTTACESVPGFTCPDAGGMCTKSDLCGDGTIDQPSEQCDLGPRNGVPDSGCSTICQVVAGFSCPDGGADGGAGCAQMVLAACGNGVIDPGETCDDGNTVPGDGCSGTCHIEPGFVCLTVGKPCAPLCGNGVLDPGEICDLGAQNGTGQGCAKSCQPDPGYACTGTVGAASSCGKANLCGNGRLDTGEQCDSGGNNGTGGCSTTCTLVPGWKCPVQGAACLPVCGDGIVIASFEQCDFGAGNGSGGCTSGCRYQPGFVCPAAATSAAQCAATTCGDGTLGDLEECDDGNLRPYDGCSPSCTIEPRCSAGSCTSVCGDGQVSPGEACDDGNTVAGDGCSPTCTVEAGWACNTEVLDPPPTITIPILYRDMHYCNAAAVNGIPSCTNSAIDPTTTANTFLTPPTPPNGHPDFDNDQYNHVPATAPKGVKVVTGLVANALGVDNEPVFLNGQGVLTSAEYFCWWYHDVGCSATAPTGANPFAKDVWLDATGEPTTLTLALGPGAIYTFDNQAFFPLDGLGWDDPRASVNPDWYDDPQTTLDQSLEGLNGGPAPTPAERNFSFTSELHYRFTFNLAQAEGPAPAVFAFTGDDDVWAFINGRLAVDLGGMHDAASSSITLDGSAVAKYGLQDGLIYSIDLFQAERHVFRSTYLLTLKDFVHQQSVCTANCGSGVPVAGEQCDFGAGKNKGGYEGCTNACMFGPYCGDGVVQTPEEQCDLGSTKNTGGPGGCNPNCTVATQCGDGLAESGEQCDYGTANNTGTYGGCTSSCMLAPYCGDGKVDPQEQCDLGTAKNTGAYGTCNPNCTLASSCGDGVVDTADGEICDNGSQNVPAEPAPYGAGLCTTQCKPAPFCGDGTAQSPEQCDDGANNGAASSTCDVQCKLKCGDGILQAGEQCDLGASNNNGAYGGCNANCTLAGYCGDGKVESPEQCDNGASNVSSISAYGSGVCTTECTTAPFCGDGITEPQFGEVCDGTSNCAGNCKSTVSPGSGGIPK